MIAVDIDGVLLRDTFSPVLRELVEELGGTYSSEIERRLFSRPQYDAAESLIEVLHLDIDPGELIDLFFDRRKRFIEANGAGLEEGVPEFLQLLDSLDVPLVCYGGLSESYFQAELGEWCGYFARYICTNDFRPGVKEIIRDISKLEFEQSLFIDDVNTVAETAKMLNVPFIGCPASHAWGHQREAMMKTGVQFLISSVRDIDGRYIEKIDMAAAQNGVWSRS